ncbi:MAG: hypothetical protein WA996_08760 [Candidatus Promineifilaceae bacterium]
MLDQKVLLLNASNMDAFPVYPYAFIQVPAVARRAGVAVICKDMLGVPQEKWEQTIQAMIERDNPIMILITLRNTDSLTSQDYEVGGSTEGDRKAYFPIERTKELIAAIRVVSNLKIAVGGFGFSLLPEEIMRYLRPDFGVFGGADAFFAHFEDIQAGNLGEVANLLFFQEDKLLSNPRVFFPPLAETEYTPQAIEEMMGFYDLFPSPGFLGAPVEIMRGCIHSCVFCSEPHVGGRQVRYRDLSAVMGDIEILADYGITKIYIISSELNPKSNEFVLALADKIRLFNERQTEDRKVNWFGANYLLKFSLEEYERLYESGFTGGWFDITALDDENAGAMRTPYRNASLLTHLKTYVQFERTRLDQLQAREESQPEVIDSQDVASRKNSPIKWSLFLGNPATTSETIRNTIRTANQEGLSKLFSSCGINTHIRVFDYEDPDEATMAVTTSVTPNLARTGYQQILPSFAYPPGLLREFGSEDEIERMFDHIAKTYLSKKYEESRDWHSFVKRKATPESIASWIAELSGTRGVHLPADISLTTKGKTSEALQSLFSEEPQLEERYTYEKLAKQFVDSLLSACLEEFSDLYGSLGLPTTMDKLERMTPYDLAVALFNRWSSEKELVDDLTEQTRSVLNESMQYLNGFCVQAMLYRFNVQIKPKYRGLFVSYGLTVSEQD